ncbi:MAG: DUF333 domain-containing protein [Anaerolineaceae bacterium]|nr:MAG: DUF333 domain-containing protein [Anaerolineaceae bacterium]
MFSRKNFKWIFGGTVLVLALSACGGVQPEPTTTSETVSPGLPSPAAIYCEGLGYTLENRPYGEGMDAVCIFPDGNECWQWDFMAGRCGKEYTYCLEQGFTLEVGANIGTCVFPDGSSCLEIDFFQGRCRPEVGLEPTEDITPSEPGMLVVGWLGNVVSTPDGAQFDDFIVLWPEGIGEFGIEGVDELVEAQIVELRDKEEPGKYAHFWGRLNCDVLDYGGCQLLATRIRSGTEITDPESIEGWEGKLYSQEPGAQFDTYFVLDGEIPVRYGIASFIAENGWPIYKEELKALRDTELTIRVSGQLVCGVPDYAGCQIQVISLEVDGVIVDPYDGWAMYTNEEYGFTFRYPSAWMLEEVPDEDTTDEGGLHYGKSVQLRQGDLLLYIGYRFISEDVFLGGTGMPAGEAEERGFVYFLGGEIMKTAVIYEGKVKVVFYDTAEVDDLVFVIRLDDLSVGDYETIDIPEVVQFEVDNILGSFERTE